MKKIDYTQRNAAIDILRATTMLLMIFVNDLWRISNVPAWLGHAGHGQDFLGLADIVFPCFLFSVGMSIPFAIENRFSRGKTEISTLGHILSRTFALLIMGVFLVNAEAGISASAGMSMPVYRTLMITAFFMIWNMYPITGKPAVRRMYTALKAAGFLILIYLAFIFRDPSGGVLSARWWGILGIIGWTYLLCAVIYLFARDRVKYLAAAWLAFMIVCILRANTIAVNALMNLPPKNFFDELLNVVHIDKGASAAFTAAGMLFSVVWMKYMHVSMKKKLICLSSTAAILLIAAYLANNIWIISKLGGTPTWVFYCLAIAAGLYGAIYWLIEKGKASWFNMIKPAGTATLTCYLMPYGLYGLLSLFDDHIPESLTSGLPGIMNCIAFAFLTIGVTYLLGKINIKLKI